MNYKFQAFESELSNPTIESVSTAFTIGAESVTVTAILNANGSKLYGVELGQMPNTDTWGDAEVIAFAAAQLETFKV
tara:strand:+ start:670 stop:900 length:231 start_codon:yes stop_codon:yes gene_type:complete